MACSGSEWVGPRHHRGTAVEHYAGIDVSLERSSVCVVDATGRVIREAKVASEPEALVGFFAGLGVAVTRKSPPAQEVRALLVGRKLLQGKLLDVELSIRGILRGFGLKVGEVSKGRFAARVRELAAGQPMLERVVEPMLRAREALRAEYQVLHRAVLAIVREDATCRRLMGVPGVGPLVAIIFTSAVDDPARFQRSRAVGAHFGLTPKKYQSGETDITGGISKVGDAMVRTALYEAANVMLTRAGKFSTLKRWALEAAKRRGMRRAKVALARKLATVLHRLWVEGSEFRFGKQAAAA